MKSPSDSVVMVIDKGLFLPCALKLAEQCKHVYWCNPAEQAFPTLKQGVIGDGFDNLEMVEDLWGVKDNVDVFVFPDIGYAGLQLELESQGFPVFGSRKADELETNRGKFLKTIAELEMPVPKYVKIQGITALKEHLVNKEDKYIKVSKWRGDCETWHFRDWSHDESMLDFLAFKLGPARELLTFYVIDPIDTDIEDGVDTFCINGKLPKTCLHGMEAKDKAFLGTMVSFDSIAENIREVSEQFAPVLARYGYRNFFSTEVRVAGDDSYFIDPTLRAGSPPHQMQTELIANYAEVICAGANGEVVDPIPSAEFGAQILIKSKVPKEMWAEIELPKELKQWVKCGGACEIDGKLCRPPDDDCDMGWLVATGDTIEEVINNLKKYAAELPDGLSADPTSLADLLMEVNKAEEQGMPFTTQEVPEPATVLNGE